ncbi:MAG: DMT family transporter [Cytophagales bacterium]|nr:DMT family transporter [Cytophagales bacterium]
MRDFLKLHFIVLLWGFTAILGKLISIPAVELVLLRTFFAAIGLLVVIAYTRRTYKINGVRNNALIAAAGVLIGAHWILFFLAAQLSNVSVCLAGMATTAIWTGLVEPLSMNKRVKPYELMIGGLGFLGMLVIIQDDFQYGLGFAVAVAAAILSAFFTVINGHVVKGNDPVTISFYEMGFAALAILLFLPVYHINFEATLLLIPQGMDWLYLFVLVMVCTVYAFTVSVELMRRISAFTINLIINLEPVYGIILALLIFGASEKMSSSFYFGTGIILISVLIYPPIQRHMEKRSQNVDLS